MDIIANMHVQKISKKTFASRLRLHDPDAFLISHRRRRPRKKLRAEPAPANKIQKFNSKSAFTQKLAERESRGTGSQPSGASMANIPKARVF